MKSSKEALKRIETAWPFNVEGKESVYRAYISSSYHYYKDFDLVMRDLEVLEILKDKLPHITTLRVMECEGNYDLYNSINCTSITKEEYELLKEWLKNEQ